MRSKSILAVIIMVCVLAFPGSVSAFIANNYIVNAWEDSIDTSWTLGTAWDLVNSNGFQSGTSGASGFHSTSDDADGHWTGNDAVIDAAAPSLTPGPCWVKYEFDHIYQLNELKIWNHTIEWNWASWTFQFGAKDIILGYSVDGTNWSEIAINGLNNGTGKGWNIGYAGEEAVTDDIYLGTIYAKYVAITFMDNYGTGDWSRTSLAEVQFWGIPEPTTVLLLGLGGLFLRKRK